MERDVKGGLLVIIPIEEEVAIGAFTRMGTGMSKTQPKYQFFENTNKNRRSTRKLRPTVGRSGERQARGGCLNWGISRVVGRSHPRGTARTIEKASGYEKAPQGSLIPRGAFGSRRQTAASIKSTSATSLDDRFLNLNVGAHVTLKFRKIQVD